jgi:hypothetical protein
MRAPRTALAIVLLLVLAGCKERSPAYGLCATILDCRTGETCSAGLCGPGPTAPAGPFAVELVPGSGGGDAPVHQEIAKQLISGEIALTFAPPAELSGRIVIPGNDFSRAASLTLSRRSPIGLADEIYSADASPDKAPPDVAFRLRVPATTTADDAACADDGADCYELRVVPADHAIPPLVRRLALAADRAEDIALAGAGASSLFLTTHVRDAALRGLPGLAVRLLDATGRMVSSSAETNAATEEDDTSAGQFGLTLPATCDTVLAEGCLAAGDYWLEIAESKDAPDAPRFISRLTIPAGPLTSPVPGVPDVVLPPLMDKAVVRVSFVVKGKARNGESERVPGALVRATSLLKGVPAYTTPADCTADLCGVFTRQGTTDTDGSISFVLLGPDAPATPGDPQLPRDYDVGVVPGPNSPYSAMLSTVEVDSDAAFAPVFVLTPARKLEISGTVVDADGAPVAGATIAAITHPAAEPLGVAGKGPSALDLVEPPSNMQSDARGNFLLFVEPGETYDVTVVPPAGAPQPAWVLPYQRFTAPAQLDVRLPPAALVEGTVVDWSGNPAPGALVRFYETVSDPDTSVRVLYLRGEAVSDGDGRLKLLLPVSGQ